MAVFLERYMSLKERIQQIQAERAAQLRKEAGGIKWSREEIEKRRLKELKKELALKAILSLCMPVLEELNEECLERKGFFIRSRSDTLKVVWDVREVKGRNNFRYYRGKAISVTAKSDGWVDICGNITWDEVRERVGGEYSSTYKVTRVREGRVCSFVRLRKLGLMRKIGFKREELEKAVVRAFLEPSSWDMSKDEFEDLFSIEEIREKAVLLG